MQIGWHRLLHHCYCLINIVDSPSLLLLLTVARCCWLAISPCAHTLGLDLEVELDAHMCDGMGMVNNIAMIMLILPRMHSCSFYLISFFPDMAASNIQPNPVTSIMIRTKLRHSGSLHVIESLALPDKDDESNNNAATNHETKIWGMELQVSQWRLEAMGQWLKHPSTFRI